LTIRKTPKGDDEEVDRGLDEISVPQRHFVLAAAADDKFQPREVDAADNLAYDRHDEVLYQRSDNLAERCADDDAHREIHHVALADEGLKFLDEAHSANDRVFRKANVKAKTAVDTYIPRSSARY